MGQSSILPLSDKDLLKEWDFDRFFNNLNLNPQRSSSSGSAESTKDKPGAVGTSRLRKHTRNGSVDASATSGLRRENSDFSMLLPRHSANLADHIRSSGVGGAKPSSIPEVQPADASSAEVAPRRSASSLFSSFSKKINISGEWKPTRPRRERTDGDIVLKNRANVWELRKNEVERRSELNNTLRSNSSTLLTTRNRHSFIYDDQSQVRPYRYRSISTIHGG